MTHAPKVCSVLALSLFAFAASIIGCGSDDAATDKGSSQTSATGAGGASTSSAEATGSGGAGAGATTSTTGATTGSGGSGGGAGELPDPNLDGPFGYAEIDDTAQIAANGNSVPIHCAYPTSGPSAGPYPVVVVAHGFQLPASQYYSYVRRLATFGYVALTADFKAGLLSVNNVENAQDLVGAIDWAAQAAALAGKADTSNVGTTGHSLGGKLAILAATMDTRIKATITLDPVDASMGCQAQNCPDVSMLMPIPIPTGFIGETTDASGGFQPCAPAADNFETYYAGTTSPSLQVTAIGANHMSFLDDVASCGLTCSFCNAATAPNAQVNAMSRAFVVAFYERHLRGIAGYDDYLTGATAQARYVTTNQATIASK